MPTEHPSKCSRIQFEDINRDLGSRKQICEFPINRQDEIRRAYLKEGPYQPKNIDYPYNDDNRRHRKSAPYVKNLGYALGLDLEPSTKQLQRSYCLFKPNNYLSYVQQNDKKLC